MKKFKSCIVGLLLTATSTTAIAGGILTNTNQSIDFLRNPARDAAIGLDGVYSNPAGVAFMPKGFHLGINWQYAHQTRTITSTNELFRLGAKNGGNDTKTFKGIANAPFIPSVQAAWNTGNWSFQFNFSIPGGGGKCEFADGLGSFETAVGAIATGLQQTSNSLNQLTNLFGSSVPNVTGYDADGYMKGRQYYFGFQLGAAYKINEHLSVYGGVRVLYGSATYEARLNNIKVMNGTDGISLPKYFEEVKTGLTKAGVNLASNGATPYITALTNKLIDAGVPASAATAKATETVKNAADKLQALADPNSELNASAEKLAPYANGMNLKSDQSGVGVAPVLGIDYKIGAFNFAAKYEFKTRMRMKNNSTLEKAVIEATKKFEDGTTVPEDAPALLAVGAQWSIIDNVRVNLGYHHFFDKQAHWYNHTEKLLSCGTNEYLFGAEWDIIKKLTVSAGGQITRYGLTDEYMNDMSFVVNSWSFGVGLNYQVAKHVKLKAAYFQTNYGTYDMNTPVQTLASIGETNITVPAGHNSFTRTNNVFGLGVDLNF